MDTFFIFGAKYLWLISVLTTFYFLWKLQDRKRFELFAIWTLTLSFAIGKIANWLIYNPRPFVVGNFTPLIEHTADNGFPSDHVLLVAAIAATLSFFDRRIAIWLWVIAVLVAVSRVYTGVHHAADVIGSILLSLIAAGVVYFLSKNKQNASNSTRAE